MKKKIGKIVFAIVILAFLLIQVYPIIWLFMASVKPTIELSTTPFALPKVVTFENFIKVFSDGKIGIYMWNSLKVTGISLILIIFLSSTVGYALSKFRIRGKKQIYKFFTFGIMVPVQITLIPLFIFYSKMGILNTSFSLILPQVGFALPLAVMMFVSFYDFVPDEGAGACLSYQVNLSKTQLSNMSIVNAIFEEVAEHHLIQPTFLMAHPAEISPLARRNDENPEVTDRFELFIGGREIGNGFSELNDAEDQNERFDAQVAAKEAGDDEAMFKDDDFVVALEHGLPPTAGEGLGIDRLAMLYANAPSIRDVILFPAMRQK